MIKKFLIWSILSVCVLLGFSNAWQVRPVGTYGTSPYDSSLDLNVISKWSLLTNKMWYTKNMLYFTDSSNKAFLYWWSSGIPYVYLYAPANPHTRDVFIQWQFLNYYICNQLTSSSTDWPGGCSLNAIWQGTEEVFSNFFWSITTSDYRYFDFAKNWNFAGGVNSFQYNRAKLNVCFSSSAMWKSICFNTCTVTQWWWSTVTCSSNSFNNNTNSVVDVFGFGTGISFDNFNTSYLYNSPGVNSNWSPNEAQTWDTVTFTTDIDRYIEYYETRWWRNKSMCYVGTNDLSAVYGATGVSFNAGTWKTIYELYYYLYNSFWSNKITNVWKFVNTWLINYSQWFYEGKKYLVEDNWPDSNISVYYDNLTFPFANKSVWIFFLASNLFDNYSTESTQWQEFTYYCDIKLNYSFYKSNPEEFDDTVALVDPAITSRVKTYYNSQIVNWSWSVGFSVPDLEGTVWWSISSWNVLPEDLNPTNLFKDFYTKITNLTKTFRPSTNWILPDWIVYPLIFLVLFRIFKH